MSIYALTGYQEQDEFRMKYSHLVKPENVVLRLNFVPKGSVVFMTGICVDIYQRDYAGEYDIRKFSSIYDYIKNPETLEANK